MSRLNLEPVMTFADGSYLAIMFSLVRHASETSNAPEGVFPGG